MITLIWSSTIMSSIVISITNKFKILSQLADNGYKLKQPFVNMKFIDFSIFIPFVNIFKTFKHIKSFDPEIDNLIPLSNIEKNKYNQKKNILTILKLNMTTKLDPNRILIFFQNNQENTIYYTQSEDDYIITSVKGPISKLDKKSQLVVLNNQINELNTTYNEPTNKQETIAYDIYQENTIEKLKKLRITFTNDSKLENKQSVYTKRKI